jgi:hypothetical protein
MTKTEKKLILAIQKAKKCKDHAEMGKLYAKLIKIKETV